MPDYVQERGAAAFGTRLRRLSERLDRDVQAIYRERAVAFEPRWFPIVTSLDAHGAQTVGDLADRIGVSHAAVSQLRAELVAEGLVQTRPDAADQRRFWIELTPSGKRTAARLKPLWDAIAQATSLLCSEAAPRFLAELERLERALDERPLKNRVDATFGARAKLRPAKGATHERT
jgi:DNA-binding MarR family transcriptional regulator